MSCGFRSNKSKVGWKHDIQGRERAYAVQAWNKIPQIVMQASERLRGIHSQKPQAVRDKIADLLGDKCRQIELFARQEVDGWDCWGDEV